MKKPRSNRPLTLSPARWSCFVAAAASTVYCAASAEGEIHYSGTIDQEFNSSFAYTTHSLALSQGVSIFGKQRGSEHHIYDNAFFGIKGAAVSNELAGSNDIVFPIRGGRAVSRHRFISSTRFSSAIMQTYECSFYFQERGIYYIGFRFDNGGGKQYGWARVKWSGCPLNAFILHDYAWGDVGDAIKAGQKGSAKEEAIEQTDVKGSLGFLAYGARGLIAWRENNTSPTTAELRARYARPR